MCGERSSDPSLSIANQYVDSPRATALHLRKRKASEVAQNLCRGRFVGFCTGARLLQSDFFVVH